MTGPPSGSPRRLLAGLVPSWGHVATLLIASPIWYWPRYAFALQCLVPFYLVLFTCVKQNRLMTNSISFVPR